MRVSFIASFKVCKLPAPYSCHLRIIRELCGTRSSGGGWTNRALLVGCIVQMGVSDSSSLLMLVARAVLDDSFWCFACHRQSNFVSGGTLSERGILLPYNSRGKKSQSLLRINLPYSLPSLTSTQDPQTTKLYWRIL